MVSKTHALQAFGNRSSVTRVVVVGVAALVLLAGCGKLARHEFLRPFENHSSTRLI